jgi:perosamine synthetase
VNTISPWLNQKQTFMFFKGRVALHAILRSANIGSGDQVLLPGYTCVVVPNAINYLGAEPVYLDIEDKTYNIDCDMLEDGVGSSWNPDQAKAIIVQHTYGVPCNMDRIRKFAQKYSLIIIEDSCHALGSKWCGQEVGSFGEAAFFSSQWSKPITTGLGGWAQINSSSLQDNMEIILQKYKQPKLSKALLLELQFLAFSSLNHPRLYCIIQDIYRALGKMGLAIGSSTGTELSCQLPADYELGMHPIQRRRLLKLLDGLTGVIAQRNQNTEIIEASLVKAGIPTVVLPIGCDPVFLRYPIKVNNKEEVLNKAKKQNIQIGDWFLSPIHPNLENMGLAGYISGSCPVAENAARKVINISTDVEMNKKEINRIVEFLVKHAEITVSARAFNE